MTSPTHPIQNLDIRCAETGQQLANAEDMEEKALNEALAVLEEKGPYAMLLYIRARHKKKVADKFQESCGDLLSQVFVSKLLNCSDALDKVKKLAENLDDLLFARDLLRNALIYARYHLKAKGK